MNDNLELWDKAKESFLDVISQRDYIIKNGKVLDDGTEVDIQNLINYLYNSSYYVSGTRQAKDWMKENLDTVFEVLENHKHISCPDITNYEKMVSFTMLMFVENKIYKILEEIECDLKD